MTCISSDHDKNTCKVSKRSSLNCRRCIHKIPMYICFGKISSNCNKVTKTNLGITTSCTFSDLDKTLAKFQKDSAKIVEGVAFTRYPCLYALVEVEPKNDLVQTAKKVTKII